MVLENIIILMGNFMNGIKEGKGKYVFENGNIYDGNFNNGLPNGYGKFCQKGKWKNVLFEKGKFVKVVD